MRNRGRGFIPEHLSRTEVHQGWTPGVLQDNGRQAPPGRVRPSRGSMRQDCGVVAYFHGLILVAIGCAARTRHWAMAR